MSASNLSGLFFQVNLDDYLINFDVNYYEDGGLDEVSVAGAESTAEPSISRAWNGSSPSQASKVSTTNVGVFGGQNISIIVFSCILALSGIGNLTLLGVLLRRRKKSFLYYRIDFMLLHLCIADLIVTFCMMPLEIAWEATMSWKGGDFLCRAMAFLRVFGLYLSSLVLVCLTVDRYLTVTCPTQALASSMSRGKLMISISWAISVISSLPQIYIFHLASHPKLPEHVQCVAFGSLSETYDFAYKIMCILGLYALPSVIILLTYIEILIKILTRPRETSLFSSQSRRKCGLRRHLIYEKEKTLKMTVIIGVVFFICWTPYYCMCLWYLIDPTSARRVDERVQRGIFLFACTNSTVNPIVYGIFHVKSPSTSTQTEPAEPTERDIVLRTSRNAFPTTLMSKPGNSMNSMNSNGQWIP